MNHNQLTIAVLASALLTATSTALGADPATPAQQQCLNDLLINGEGSMTLEEVRAHCRHLSVKPQKRQITADESIEKQSVEETQVLLGSISKRIASERESGFDPYVITPHKMNYLLPALTTNALNRSVYQGRPGYQEHLDDVETKFQMSLKVPLNANNLLIEGDGLYLGFTIEAWWQIYASELSRPFRETNYQPEIFYLAPLPWKLFGGNTGFVVGLEHQSNGRGQELSRSWNRFYGHFLYEKNNFALSLKPWVRLAEEEKEFPFDPDGDDNPDIEDYMGNFELGMVYKWEDLEFSFRGRQNFDTHYGAAELAVTFPLWGKLRGYATAFNGYGESLIDYNYSQTRFGIGLSLNNVL